MRVAVTQYEGIDATPALPLAAGCLVAAARRDPELSGVSYTIAVAREEIGAAAAALGCPDVLGLSLYPWNAAYSLAVARATNGAGWIVAGGPSVPRRPERARRFLEENPAVDVLAFGEGEWTFRELLRAKRRGGGLDEIGGIAYRAADGSIVFTAAPGRVLDFSEAGSPYLDGTFDELLARERGRFHMAICETNRGCPFSCTFCDWSLTKKVVEFPLERVRAELDWVTAHGFSHVMLADANFGIRPRDTSIARYLVELRRERGLPATFYFYLTKNNHGRNLETIEILEGGGIGTWVGLAVQDFDDGVLEAVKRDRIQTGEAMKLREICGERGIPTFNELILGLPGQTYESFAQTIAMAMPPLPRHDFVLFLCRLIDNTELGDPESRERFGLETRRCLWKTSTPGWEAVIDEYQEVVVATRDMPLAAWRRTYKLSFFAAALYNLRLLRVVLHHVPEATGLTLAEYLEVLTEEMSIAAPGTVYAELGATMERYEESLLGGGPFVLPADEEDGECAIPVDEAVAMAALRRYGAFLRETETATRRACGSAAGTLGEAFRYQEFAMPRWGRPEAVEAEFAHDWPAYAAGTPLEARVVRLRFTPELTVTNPQFRAFAANHFACVRARMDAGRVERIVDEAGPAAHALLAVLPAGG